MGKSAFLFSDQRGTGGDRFSAYTSERHTSVTTLQCRYTSVPARFSASTLQCRHTSVSAHFSAGTLQCRTL
uniref:Uncharacterized protein n=1 Tax=Globodera pallida TaxID=36090 RepID=A0A183BPP5_GLOPA